MVKKSALSPTFECLVGIQPVRSCLVLCWSLCQAIKSMFLRHLELLQLNHLHMNTQKKYKAEMHKAWVFVARPPLSVAEHPFIP